VEAGDQVTELTGKIRSTQNTIKKYLLTTEKRAYIVSLSQVGNRGAYMEKMEKVGLGQPFTIMALDIDYLKKVNDTFGHNYGDQYIQKIAEILKKTCLEQGIDLGDGYHHHTIFRIGGDEFAIITQEMSEEQRQQFKDSLNANLDAFNQQKKLPFPLSVSIGCANFDPKEDHSFLDAYEKADKEMYIQKKARHSTNPFDFD
jgi:diguanylate cyclase (GGDEF)-like protein